MNSIIVIARLLKKRDGYLYFSFKGAFRGELIDKIICKKEQIQEEWSINRGYILQLDTIRLVRGKIIGRLVKVKIIEGDNNGRFF